MYKRPFIAVAIACLAGCASKPPFNDTTYSYDSTQHSGTVHVTERNFTSEDKTCPAGWRDGQVYTMKGIPDALEGNMALKVIASLPNGGPTEYIVKVPQTLGERVVARDFQQSMSYMLGAEQNGMVQQGEAFYWPEGFYVRVSRPEIVGNDMKACIGVDRMYVLKADLERSSNPPVYLDRAVIPYSNDTDEPVRYTFGSQETQIVDLYLDPK